LQQFISRDDVDEQP